MITDYLILGSGLSALTFGALMAKANKKVLILEAHEFPGGFGHTFIEKNKKHKYHFNAQFHYVWDCGINDPIYHILSKLGLQHDVTFLPYGKNGYDRMRIPGHALDIPSDFTLLKERLAILFPKDARNLSVFLDCVVKIAKLLKQLRKPLNTSHLRYARKHLQNLALLKYYNKSLQNVFDEFSLPKPAQTLLANQWLDFLLPPCQLSFYAWCILFEGYTRGAYYPKHHFEHVINSLVNLIIQQGGEIIYNQTVEKILLEKRHVVGVVAHDTNKPALKTTYTGKTVISNIDPQYTAELIGIKNFSAKLRRQLNYEYSYSNFVVYGAVEGIDLRHYGFGDSNLFHSGSVDLNHNFTAMYQHLDYSQIGFGMATPSLVGDDSTGCPPGQQIFELLTVANYRLFKHLKYRSNGNYNKLKLSIYNQMLDVIEQTYVPNFREHIVFKMLGSPTTNVSYCWAPQGNSYGMNLTPNNMSLNKLGNVTSFKNLFFCNASSGSPSFAKAFNNGAILYENLTQDPVFRDY